MPTETLAGCYRQPRRHAVSSETSQHTKVPKQVCSSCPRSEESQIEKSAFEPTALSSKIPTFNTNARYQISTIGAQNNRNLLSSVFRTSPTTGIMRESEGVEDRVGLLNRPLWENQGPLLVQGREDLQISGPLPAAALEWDCQVALWG